MAQPKMWGSGIISPCQDILYRFYNNIPRKAIKIKNCTGATRSKDERKQAAARLLFLCPKAYRTTRSIKTTRRHRSKQLSETHIKLDRETP